MYAVCAEYGRNTPERRAFSLSDLEQEVRAVRPLAIDERVERVEPFLGLERIDVAGIVGRRSGVGHRGHGRLLEIVWF